MTFVKKNVKYDFRNNSTFGTRNVKCVYYGSERISFIGPKMWELLPNLLIKY